ncbi:MAG: TonB-dependent receptor [Pseudomonadales bacterium]|nr:TonB-dependent receptor [Pseudomonadales bacterium]
MMLQTRSSAIFFAINLTLKDLPTRFKKLVGCTQLILYTCFTCLLNLLYVDHALAKNANPTDPGMIAEVIVTARRRSENLQKVPIAVSVVKGDQLDIYDLGLSEELQGYIPNLTMANAFSASAPNIYLRGAGNSDYNDNSGGTVGVYIDEVFLNAPAGKLFQVYDQEQVQVLRGPQGTLFGKNSTAGAISFHSRLPHDEFEAYGTVTSGKYAQLDFEGAINLPLTEAFSGRIAINQRKRDGYAETRDQNNVKVRDNGRIDEEAVRILLNYADNNTTALLNLNHAEAFDDRTPYKGYGTSADGTNSSGWQDPDPSVRVNYSNFPEFDDVDTNGYFLTVHQDLGSMTLSSITARYDASRIISLEADQSPFDIINITRDVEAKQISQELRLSNNTVDAQDTSWVFGLYYFTEDLDSEAGLGVLAPGATLPQAYTSDTNTVAAFSEFIFNLNSRWKLTLGSRYTVDKKNIRLNSVPSATTNFRDDETWQEWTGRIILDQSLSDDTLLYYSLSRGFQGGGFNGGLVTAGEKYEPEVLTAYEFGIKSQIFANSTRINTALFYYDYQDIQVFTVAEARVGDINASNIATENYTNSDSATIYGLEVELQTYLTDRLYVSSALGLLHSEYHDLILLSGAQVISGDGNPLINAPDTTFSLAADYELPTSMGNLHLHADYNFHAERNFDITDRDRAQGNAYGLFNMKISYAQKNWQVALWGKNLTDKTYSTIFFPLDSFNFNYYAFGLPRTYGAQFTYRL